MHSIATMAEVLRRNPGSRGLVTANGGYLTKHSFGVPQHDPAGPAVPPEDVQAEVDANPPGPRWSGGRAPVQWSPGQSHSIGMAAEKAFLAVEPPVVSGCWRRRRCRHRIRRGNSGHRRRVGTRVYADGRADLVDG